MLVRFQDNTIQIHGIRVAWVLIHGANCVIHSEINIVGTNVMLIIHCKNNIVRCKTNTMYIVVR